MKKLIFKPCFVTRFVTQGCNGGLQGKMPEDAATQFQLVFTTVLGRWMSGEDAGEFGLFASGGRRSIQLSCARRLFEINDLKGNK
jgi:hypothetical protein